MTWSTTTKLNEQCPSKDAEISKNTQQQKWMSNVLLTMKHLIIFFYVRFFANNNNRIRNKLQSEDFLQQIQ